jgi:hypothetical protein
VNRAVVLLAVAVALAAPASAAALCAPNVKVALTPDGPAAPVLHVQPGSLLGWSLPDGAAPSRVVFENPPCAIDASTAPAAYCGFTDPGEYRYRVEGFGAGEGTVVVDPVTWLAARAATRTVVFGDRLVLRGTVFRPYYCGPPGFRPRVRVVRRSVGVNQTRHLKDVVLAERSDPTFDRWRTVDRPRIGAVYRFDWRGNSTTARVNVRPRVTLRRAGPRMLATSVRSLRGYAGRWVAVQRWAGMQWRFVRAVRLAGGSRVRLRVRRAGIYRLFISRATAGRGYVAGSSRAVRVR